MNRHWTPDGMSRHWTPDAASRHWTPDGASRHWTIDELTDHLYGIREGDEHLESCRECALRFEELRCRRAEAAASPEISASQLAAQRRAILERIDAPVRRVPGWVPALTAAFLLAVAVFVYRPVYHPAPAVHQPDSAPASDAQLFADIYNVEESAEPAATAPIHGLFQEGQQ